MNEWKPTTELPKEGDFILIHKWCDIFAGWFYDYRNGVPYEDYVASYEPDDEDDKPECRDNYEYDRYRVSGFAYDKGAYWHEVIEWMPIPEVYNGVQNEN